MLAELKNAANATEKIKEAEGKVKEMEHRLTIVAKSKEVELKKFRIAAGGLVSERHAVEQEVESLKVRPDGCC